MGNPPTEDFVAGVQCVAFETAFGEITTPKTIRVTMSDVVKCPIYPNTPINGSFIITQLPNPCEWQGFSLTQEFLWSLVAPGVMECHDIIFPRGVFFFAVGMSDSHVNAAACPGFAGTGGTIVLTWGPEIPPL